MQAPCTETKLLRSHRRARQSLGYAIAFAFVLTGLAAVQVGLLALRIMGAS